MHTFNLLGEAHPYPGQLSALLSLLISLFITSKQVE